MRDIRVSTDVFARIWSLRRSDEDSEDAILRRVLWDDNASADAIVPTRSTQSSGLCEPRFGVVFEEGFKIERAYLGKTYFASVQKGQWVIEGIAGRFSKLNELSRAIGTKTENAWANWFFVDKSNRRRPVSELRDPQKITTRPKKRLVARNGKVEMSTSEEKVRWCDDVHTALRDLGGRASLGEIYQRVRIIRYNSGRTTPPSLEEVVRKELEMRSSDSEVYDAERGEDWFKMAEGKGGGVWALREL